MFNNGLPDLSLFCCISFLFLPHCLSAHITCTICSSAFYPLCAMFIHCTVPLQFNLVVALSSFFTHESLSTSTTTTTQTTTTTTSLLCTMYLWLLCTLCMQCSPCLCMHTLHRYPPPLKFSVWSSSWLFSFSGGSPHVSSITVCYSEIPQPLWQFETLRLLCDSRTHLLCFSYRPQCPSNY